MNNANTITIDLAKDIFHVAVCGSWLFTGEPLKAIRIERQSCHRFLVFHAVRVIFPLGNNTYGRQSSAGMLFLASPNPVFISAILSTAPPSGSMMTAMSTVVWKPKNSSQARSLRTSPSCSRFRPKKAATRPAPGISSMIPGWTSGLHA